MVNRRELKEIVTEEQNWYLKYARCNKWLVFLRRLRHDPVLQIRKWQKYSRYTDYYNNMRHNSLLGSLMYLYYIRKRNVLARDLGFEIGTQNIKKGLKIFHFNIVINEDAVIGENLMLLGSNVIGNGGPKNLSCPVIGNNVTICAGAKVFGDVRIADNITIASGAIVISSFTESGITIGGIPARKLK